MTGFLSNCPPNILLGGALILINFPLGWIGLAFFVHLAKITGKKLFYFAGISLYIISWAALFAGVCFCGKEYAGEVFYKYHTPIILFTILAVASIVCCSLYLSKKPSKINKKAA